MFVCLNKIYSYYSNINPATSAIVRFRVAKEMKPTASATASGNSVLKSPMEPDHSENKNLFLSFSIIHLSVPLKDDFLKNELFAAYAVPIQIRLLPFWPRHL